jgi:hypothetical protein
MLKNLRLKAILCGIVVEITANFILISAFIGLLASYLQAHGDWMPPHAPSSSNVALQAGGTALASVVYLLAGYVVGRIAKQSEILNASAVGGMFLAYGVTGFGHDALWVETLNTIAILLFHPLGGWLAKRRRLRP